MEKIDLIGDFTTPYKMIEIKYNKAKTICENIWYNTNKSNFEDIFHDTIYRCLNHLGDKQFSQEYLKSYFFKAFRINMVRHYGYSYNKYKSGKEIENVLIPVKENFINHMDGFSMLDYVKETHGIELREMLWDNLNGYTYKELDNKYKTNAFYYLSKLKEELKRYYIKNYEGKNFKINN